MKALTLKFKLLFLLSFLFSKTQAADYYWVGGTGTWNDYANHWATSSGGTTFYTSFPSSIDDVFIDVNSLQPSDTIFFVDNQNYVHHFWMDPNLNYSFFDILPSITYAQLIVTGDLFVGGTIFFANQGINGIEMIMAPSSPNATIYAPLTAFASFNLNGPSTITMLSELIVYGYIIFGSDSVLFKTNDYPLECGQIVDFLPGNNMLVDMGKSTVQIQTDLFINVIADSAHIIFSGSGAFTVPIKAKKLTIDSTAYTNGYASSKLNVDEMIIKGYFESNAIDTIQKLSIFLSGDFKSTLTCDTLILANPNNFFTFSSVMVNNFMATIASPGNQIDVGNGAACTLLVNADTVCLDFMRLNNVNAIGSAVYYAGFFSDDLGGNNGWTFTSCSPLISNVWPGDVNNDLIVDNIDLLLIGAGNNFTGDVRDSVSIAYAAFPSLDWTTTYANLVNMKHGDCNGDGVIFTDDTLAISQNYGLTHPAFHDGNYSQKNASNGNGVPQLRNSFPLFPLSGIGAPLSISTSLNTLIPGASYAMPIHYGQTNGIGDMLYGIAFSIDYDINQIDPNSINISYSPCWLADTSEMLRIERNDMSLGRISGTVTRHDLQDMTGSGEIAVFHFTVASNASGNIEFDFSRTLALLSNQSQVLIQSNPIVFSVVTGINETSSSTFSLSPNPAHSSIQIRRTGMLNTESIRILDTQGRIVHREKAIGKESNYQYDISDLAAGIYFVIIQSGGDLQTVKLIVE